MRLHLFVFGLGLPALSSFEAAAAFCVARLVALLCPPGSGLQLPFSRGALPGTGSKPGQHRVFCFAPEDLLPADEDFFAVFFAVVIQDLEALERPTDNWFAANRAKFQRSRKRMGPFAV
jgi:hypothetical protein